jgi:hypothetical protein
MMSVLLASAGMPLISHICNKEGSKEIFVVAQDNCCKGHIPYSKAAIEKQPCCENEAIFLKQELPGTGQFKIAFEPLSIIRLFEGLTPSLKINTFSSAETHDPPAPSGRELLTMIQVLRT